MGNSKIGLVGLGVMGANLARNIAKKGFKVSVFNRTAEKTEDFLKKYGGENLIGQKSLKEFAESLEKPRKIIVMVSAGAAVDELLAGLMTFLEKGDVIVDCGNSYYKDTQRRFESLGRAGIDFLGCGVSGGEEGALQGPSMMPGGKKS